MNNAEMRSLLTLLGLSLKQLSTITGWDYRELRRTANGIRPVSPRIINMVERIAARADDDLRGMQTSVDAGDTVVIPQFSYAGQEPYMGEEGMMPGSYWHALAGTLLVTNDAATVIYERVAVND